MIKIGSCQIDTNVFLAPMAGCTDLSLRLISREHGAKFCFFEMFDSNSLIHGGPKKTDLCKSLKKDNPIAAQLLGSDPDTMFSAAQRLLELTNPYFLDINAACPVRKVIRKKAGAYLLLEPKALYAILRKLSSEISLPVTVKMRVGYDRFSKKEIVEIAKNCQENGAAALFVHGRTKREGYSGEVNYKAIKAIKEAVGIPVFGSGNVFSKALAQKMFDETSCDGILIARGALGNPWIFSGKSRSDIDWKERKKVLLKHLSYIEKYKDGNSQGRVVHMRKVALFYISSLPYASRMRAQITPLKTYKELVDLIDVLP
ncbi:MAG: tRNA-dihydrouridine synthase [Candidatus Saganbacteria bacterium]|nr:tRNA-dihydrouridine synthase [Candidatus Saganbacteria bacterium]